MSESGKLDYTIRRGVRACALLLLLPIAREACADTIYKCVDASGAVAFQAAPCATHHSQTTVRMRAQPLIGGEAPASSPARVTSSVRETDASSRSSREHALARRGSHRKRVQATSWECRAADGEVFYRHKHCPHSVPGDGVMRSTGSYVVRRRRGRRGGRDAWSPVAVHARKVSRSEACRQINSVAAVERDGSTRDEHASAYAHDLGRDPCAGY